MSTEVLELQVNLVWVPRFNQWRANVSDDWWNYNCMIGPPAEGQALHVETEVTWWGGYLQTYHWDAAPWLFQQPWISGEHRQDHSFWPLWLWNTFQTYLA